jgi:dihydroorotate dehydrogenase electron transfer subunit
LGWGNAIVLLRDAEIIFNNRLGPELYHLGLLCPDIAARIKPGQFIMVRLQESFDPLLRRPFAVHRMYQNEPPGSFEVLFKVVGRGTRLLAGMLPGYSLNLLGPLGRGFRLPNQDGFLVMIAGGIGVAPLPYLAQTLVESYLEGRRVLWFGGKGSADLVCVEHFEDMGFEVELVTEDGSVGRPGMVTDHLEYWFAQQQEMAKLIYSCGPYAMQRLVAKMSIRLNIPCQLSMEALMACGVGACLSCSLRCRPPEDGQEPHYANVCQDGPVFDGDMIVWD